MTRIIPLILLATCACSSRVPPSERTPSAATVARIERKLSKDPCTGALVGLTRFYAYPWRSGAVDDRTIFVTLRASGATSDIIILPPHQSKSQSARALGWGIYDVRNDRLTLAECATAA
jgi:hypothetical protein